MRHVYRSSKTTSIIDLYITEITSVYECVQLFYILSTVWDILCSSICVPLEMNEQRKKKPKRRFTSIILLSISQLYPTHSLRKLHGCIVLRSGELVCRAHTNDHHRNIRFINAFWSIECVKRIRARCLHNVCSCTQHSYVHIVWFFWLGSMVMIWKHLYSTNLLMRLNIHGTVNETSVGIHTHCGIPQQWRYFHLDDVLLKPLIWSRCVCVCQSMRRISLDSKTNRREKTNKK